MNTFEDIENRINSMIAKFELYKTHIRSEINKNENYLRINSKLINLNQETLGYFINSKDKKKTARDLKKLRSERNVLLKFYDKFKHFYNKFSIHFNHVILISRISALILQNEKIYNPFFKEILDKIDIKLSLILKKFFKLKNKVKRFHNNVKDQ